MSTTAELLKGAAELFPGEVVTQAHVRHFDLPLGAGRFALITLDNGHDHTKPTTLGPQSLANIDAALDQVEKEAADGDIVGVGVTGKPFIFAVGADLKGVELLKRHEDALAIGKGGHDVLKRLANLAVPSFAYYNGAAMGGGVEIGLHCTYRTVSAALPAFSLPEVFLGLVPGWGGCTLLPNLIGADKAVSVIIENSLNQNKQLKGAQVHELGIADAIFEGADFLEQSLIWTASVLKGEITVERPLIDRGGGLGRRPSPGAASSPTARCTAPPAAYRALDVIAAGKSGVDLQQGYDAEDQAPRRPHHGRRTALRQIYAFNLVHDQLRQGVGGCAGQVAGPPGDEGGRGRQRLAGRPRP
ncbi:3-hydroxyacyl-CoA dehydrogenase NAD-binding domain-containing protein [Streptomyces violaceorubidus]